MTRPTARPGSRSHVRRTAYAFFHLNDGAFLDIASLLNGRLRTRPIRQVCAISILNGEEATISLKDLRLLFRIPSDTWTPVRQLIRRRGVRLQQVQEAARKGLLVTDDPGLEFRALRRRDEALASGAWNIYAALYHFMTKWQNVNLGLSSPLQGPQGNLPLQSARAEELDSEQLLHRLIARHGSPPDHFYTLKRPLVVHELPLVRRRSEFYRILTNRRTTRSFRANSALRLEQLAVLLYYVYGCHGYAGITENIVGLKKTSPSGGGLHPTEVYPLIINVEKVKPGLYHYNIRDHSLEAIRLLERRQAVK